MKCACGAVNPQKLVTVTNDGRGEGEEQGNIHVRLCDLCHGNWESSANYRLAWQHAKEGREGLFLAEFRNWQAVQRVTA